MRRTQVRLLWRDNSAHREFTTGVSLHSHTMHSRENLGFIPRYTAVLPPLAWEIRRQEKKYREKHGRELDFARGFWTPPLPAPNAHDLERRHIEDQLGLAALVSLTDHDNIEAACQLRSSETTAETPISFEWTVPVGPTFFHVGIHNLPAVEAQAIVEELAHYTRNPSPSVRNELLASITRREDTLVVLNHPLWDQGGVGAERHRAMLHELLDSSGGFLHALEINGLRPWPENQELMHLSRALDCPLVSGGDRHGCEPAAAVNVTRATTFPEFVSEVRAGASQIILLNHYREQVRFRIFKSVCDIMRDYPELSGRVKWSERVFCRMHSGAVSSLSEVMNGDSPRVIRYFERMVRLAGSREFQNMLRLWFADGASPPVATRPPPGLPARIACQRARPR